MKLLDFSDMPSWSADSGAVVAGTRDGVVVVSRRGEVLWRLGRPEGWEFGVPVWSPDGREIALAGFRGEERGIFLVGVDGAGLHRITSRGTRPIWSPDSSSIAFADPKRFEPTPLLVVDRDGGTLRRVAADHESASWSPDGTQLVYANGGDLFTVARDGSKTRRLTRTIGIDENNPVWQPVRSAGVANAWAKRGARLC